MTPLHPGDRLDHYIIDETVARGGMATIFRGRDMRTGVTVALKVPHPESECDPVMFDRFRRETQIGEQIDHPGVVKVYRQDRRCRLYMAAEWIDGKALREILNAEKKLSVERALRLAIGICDALEHIHANGIVHRDLKPDNVMVFPDDGIKLIDFGLASQARARRLTFGKFSRLMGTADYISPEQVRGKRGDARSDIYALGVMLYEMLAGRSPWEGENPFTILNERTLRDPAPLRSLNGDVPEAVEAIVNKAIRRDPTQRYSSAGEFMRALKEPGRAETAAPEPASDSGVQPKRSWMISLAMIPVSIFLMLLYAASHQ
jgi:serine/threonine-protein kinase